MTDDDVRYATRMGMGGGASVGGGGLYDPQYDMAHMSLHGGMGMGMQGGGAGFGMGGGLEMGRDIGMRLSSRYSMREASIAQYRQAERAHYADLYSARGAYMPGGHDDLEGGSIRQVVNDVARRGGYYDGREEMGHGRAPLEHMRDGGEMRSVKGEDVDSSGSARDHMRGVDQHQLHHQRRCVIESSFSLHASRPPRPPQLPHGAYKAALLIQSLLPSDGTKGAHLWVISRPTSSTWASRTSVEGRLVKCGSLDRVPRVEGMLV